MLLNVRSEQDERVLRARDGARLRHSPIAWVAIEVTPETATQGQPPEAGLPVVSQPVLRRTPLVTSGADRTLSATETHGLEQLLGAEPPEC